MAFNGTQYLVVWQDSRTPYGIYGTRVTTTGTVVDPGGLGLFVSPTNQPATPAVASDGTNWFVVWYDYARHS